MCVRYMGEGEFTSHFGPGEQRIHLLSLACECLVISEGRKVAGGGGVVGGGARVSNN